MDGDEKFRRSSRKSNERMKDLKITFAEPEMYVGMVVEKTKTICTCTGVDYTENGYVNLVWEAVLKTTGKKREKKVMYPLWVSSLPSTSKAFIGAGNDGE